MKSAMRSRHDSAISALTDPERLCAADRQTEQQIHRAVVQHLRQRGMSGVVFLHPANGGYRLPTEAAALSGLGVRPGAADLLLWHGGNPTARQADDV